MIRASVGTGNWAALGGDLRRRDRARLVGQALLLRLARLPRQARAALGIDEAAARRIDPATIRLPDSLAARRAGEILVSLSEPWLQNHCLRTYLWGAMLAQGGKIVFDEELFFVASLLHDLGLTGDHCGTEPGCNCFAVEGARAAARMAGDFGWERERQERLAEAISLHLNVTVGLRQGPEAHLLHAGAAFDVIGARSRELHPVTIADVLGRHPRLDLKHRLAAAMQQQASARPGSRAAFLVGLGFVGLIRAAPFADGLPHD